MANVSQSFPAAKHFALNTNIHEFMLVGDTCVFGKTNWTQLHHFLAINQAPADVVKRANQEYAAHVMKHVVAGFKTNRVRNKEGYVVG